MEERMSNELHVILGTGPVGCWIAIALRELTLPVRAVNRSGKRPDLMPADVEMIAADLSDVANATAAAQGATVIYQALNPAYHEWPKYFPGLQAAALAAARSTGARYVSIENLYMYDSSLRSSDYYGPGVLGSALGALVFGNLVAGKKAQVGGSAVRPHSFAYIEDVGRAAVTLGRRAESLGRAWIAPHAPATTQGEVVEKACRALNIRLQLTVVSPLMMRLAGLFIPAARESVEMLYEFTEPFVVDSARIQRVFGLEPTPLDIGLERTTSWYKQHARTH
jgi:nucleoside-diphosphate-sugar epimerase